MDKQQSNRAVYFLAKVAEFTSESAREDSNGLWPVVLTPIGGKSPRGRNIVSGTIAQSEGFEVGKTYLVLATHVGQVETEDGEITESYNYTSIAEYDKKEVVEYVMQHPLQDSVIPPRNQQAVGNSTSIPKVKGNPRARRIREREEQENPENSKTEGTEKPKPATKRQS